MIVSIRDTEQQSGHIHYTLFSRCRTERLLPATANKLCNCAEPKPFLHEPNQHVLIFLHPILLCRITYSTPLHEPNQHVLIFFSSNFTVQDHILNTITWAKPACFDFFFIQFCCVGSHTEHHYMSQTSMFWFFFFIQFCCVGSHTEHHYMSQNSMFWFFFHPILLCRITYWAPLRDALRPYSAKFRV
jgi:hypothetical protein